MKYSKIIQINKKKIIGESLETQSLFEKAFPRIFLADSVGMVCKRLLMEKHPISSIKNLQLQAILRNIFSYMVRVRENIGEN